MFFRRIKNPKPQKRRRKKTKNENQNKWLKLSKRMEQITMKKLLSHPKRRKRRRREKWMEPQVSVSFFFNSFQCNTTSQIFNLNCFLSIVDHFLKIKSSTVSLNWHWVKLIMNSKGWIISPIYFYFSFICHWAWTFFLWCWDCLDNLYLFFQWEMTSLQNCSEEET